MESKSAEQMEYDKLQSWADLYASCSFEAKKVIACQFIKSVYVYRDYTLEIEFNVSFEDFKTLGAECEGRCNEEPAIYVTAQKNRLANYKSILSGGPEEIRTLDLSDANRTLSQLSYRPKYG